VVSLEERTERVADLAAQLEAVQRDLALSEASVSVLEALQTVIATDKWALDSSLQGCLRSMLIVRVAACPARRTAQRKRAHDVMIIDHSAVRGAFDQLIAMSALQMDSLRSTAGRVSGRLLRFHGCHTVLEMLGCWRAETKTALCNSVSRKDGTSTTRLPLERHTEDQGLT